MSEHIIWKVKVEKWIISSSGLILYILLAITKIYTRTTALHRLECFSSCTRSRTDMNQWKTGMVESSNTVEQIYHETAAESDSKICLVGCGAI
jgi:hypothetical protein